MNLGYSPEKFGLEIIARHDFANAYEFDEVIIFRNENGQLLAGHDSGCSCPIPWDDITVSDLAPVDGLHEILNFARSHVYDSNYDAATWASIVKAALAKE